MAIADLEYLFYRERNGATRPYRWMYSRRILVGIVVLMVTGAGIVRWSLDGEEDQITPTPLEPISTSVLEPSPLPQESTVPVSAEHTPLPPPFGVTARAVLLVEESGKELLSYHAHKPLPPASLTKLVTFAVLKEQTDFSGELTIPSECIGRVGNSTGLRVGEVWRESELLEAMLLLSATDATCTLALHYAAEEDFIAGMNLWAEAHSLNTSRFVNFIGLDAPSHVMSAEDVIAAGKHMYAHSSAQEVLMNQSVVRHGRTIETTNELFGKIPGLTGIKTGTTSEAGECFLFRYEREGRVVWGVVMGSSDRFIDTQVLLQNLPRE